ncbi:bifunctional phosphoribosyl-AMP cyclohydrolase/phosphoribosyl-ATP diphosphatase HisIE [Eubacteriales bacterium OttesenSCG-928-K08]|nr:bifunctional phosphoribosyl-AMP cyclohydrolase/phosphoribosyl-ATP diphosphatase HisIE [Eubacteriales bacterium OttesenSCG-928-K08]
MDFQLKFDEKGLIPAIVQDYFSREVLTLAYMNEQSLRISMDEGYTCFYSRSRQQLWRKGETSGNRQKIIRITADCDFDALVVEVVKDGPACHTGKESCFFNPTHCAKEIPERFSLTSLYELIAGRKDSMPEGSYTTYLFESGREKILKKVGEECTEVIIAAMKRDKKETIYEVSDLAYHVLVLLCEMGITPKEVLDELQKRHIIDHKVKQESGK